MNDKTDKPVITVPAMSGVEEHFDMSAEWDAVATPLLNQLFELATKLNVPFFAVAAIANDATACKTQSTVHLIESRTPAAMLFANIAIQGGVQRALEIGREIERKTNPLAAILGALSGIPGVTAVGAVPLGDLSDLADPDKLSKLGLPEAIVAKIKDKVEELRATCTDPACEIHGKHTTH